MRVALCFLKGVTPETVKTYPEAGLELEDFFNPTNGTKQEILRRAGVDVSAAGIKEALSRASEEIEFMDRHSIRMVFMHDPDYPKGLAEITNPPICLFYLGDLKGESRHSVSIVGTRRCTKGGIDFCDKFVEESSGLFPDLSVVSGLAFGIDAAAHRACLKHKSHTMAILAHGLDMIYPSEHRGLARDIIAAGGALVSEYPSRTTPYKGRFLERNRIVACISKAVIVVESDLRGGAMSTANTAFSYSRDVFAVPGRVSDQMSRGCNHLIMKNKARLTVGYADFAAEMGWKSRGLQKETAQKTLFPELDGDSKLIYDYMQKEQAPCSADNIRLATGLSITRVLSTLGELELDGIITRLPGNRYEIAL